MLSARRCPGSPYVRRIATYPLAPRRQPRLAPRVVRHGPLDPPPEVRRVVHVVPLAQVDEFADHDLLHDARRQQNHRP